MTQKINYNNYKIFVFDLDYTLFLHENHTKIYTDHIINLLTCLKNNNKILCIATHNRSPSEFLIKMRIRHLFNDIIYETKTLYSFDDVEFFTPKKDMLIALMHKYNCQPNDIIFFDDNPYNVDQVESIDIKSILVSDKTGVNTANIIKDFNKPHVTFIL